MTTNYEQLAPALILLSLIMETAESEVVELTPEDLARLGSLLICDPEINEVRALILENLAGLCEKEVVDSPDLESSLNHLLEVGPYAFCLEHANKGDLKRFISSPRFLRGAFQRVEPTLDEESDDQGEFWVEESSDSRVLAGVASGLTPEQNDLVLDFYKESLAYALKRKFRAGAFSEEDVAQRTTARFAKRGYREKDREYVKRMTRHMFCTMLKSRLGKSFPSIFDKQGGLAINPLDPCGYPDEVADSNEFKAKFAEILRSRCSELTDDEIAVCYKRSVERKLQQEIAEEIKDISQSTVCRLLKSAIKKLTGGVS